jgi:hypothetical protein
LLDGLLARCDAELLYFDGLEGRWRQWRGYPVSLYLGWFIVWEFFVAHSLRRPVYIFFGGLVQLLGGIGEWIIGNTFSCALFFTYGTALSSMLIQVTRLYS